MHAYILVLYIYKHKFTQLHIDICTYIHTDTYFRQFYTYLCMYTCIHICTDMHTYIYMCMYVICEFMHVMYICICALCMYIMYIVSVCANAAQKG